MAGQQAISELPGLQMKIKWIYGSEDHPPLTGQMLPNQRNAATHRINGIQFCIEENQYVYTSRGAIPAKEVKDGTPMLLGEASGVHSFQDEVYELRIGRNIRIRLNGEHPIMVKKRRDNKAWSPSVPGWMKVKDIYENRPKSANPWYAKANFADCCSGGFETISVGRPFAKLLGYLMSDGSFSEKQSVKFTNTNAEFLREVAELGMEVQFMFGFSVKNYHKGNGSDLLFTVPHGQNRSPLKDMLRGLGIIDRSTFGMIQRLQRDELEEFIKGYFNGDGSLTITKVTPIINFAVGIHERQAFELQFMLWRLGISSTIVKSYFPNLGHKHPQYFVTTANYDDSRRMLGVLEDKKYPEKFAKAWDMIAHAGLSVDRVRHQTDEEGIWLPISKVKKVGMGTVVGFETTNHLIICQEGLLTHNSGKSALGENIMYNYVRNGSTAYDFYAANDNESLVALNSPYKDAVWLVHDDSINLNCNYNTIKASDLFPQKGPGQRIYITNKRFYKTESQQFGQLLRFTKRAQERDDFNRIDLMFIREAQKYISSQTKSNQARNKKEAGENFTDFNEGMVHHGFAIILDAQRQMEISKSVRELTKFWYLKNMGRMEIPSEIHWIYSDNTVDFDLNSLRHLEPDQFLILTDHNSIGLGTFEMPDWHIHRGSGLLHSLGIHPVDKDTGREINVEEEEEAEGLDHSKKANSPESVTQGRSTINFSLTAQQRTDGRKVTTPEQDMAIMSWYKEGIGPMKIYEKLVEQGWAGSLNTVAGRLRTVRAKLAAEKAQTPEPS